MSDVEEQAGDRAQRQGTTFADQLATAVLTVVVGLAALCLVLLQATAYEDDGPSGLVAFAFVASLLVPVVYVALVSRSDGPATDRSAATAALGLFLVVLLSSAAGAALAAR